LCASRCSHQNWPSTITLGRIKNLDAFISLIADTHSLLDEIAVAPPSLKPVHKLEKQMRFARDMLKVARRR